MRRRRAKLLTDSKAAIRLHFEACGNDPRRPKQPNRTSVFGEGSKDGKWRDAFERTANDRNHRVAGASIKRSVSDMHDDIGNIPAHELLS